MALSVRDSYCFFFSRRRRHTRYIGDWSSDVCSSDLARYVEENQTIRGYTGINVNDIVKVEDFDKAFGEIGRASCRERV